MDVVVARSTRVAHYRAAAGIAVAGPAILLGASLLAYVVLFGIWLASTGVDIEGDPAAQPTRMAQQLINGAASPMWFFYVLLAALAVASMGMSGQLSRRTSSWVVGSVGTSALVVLALAMLVAAAVTEKAGSPALPKQQLEQSVPVLFGVVIPALLSAFCLMSSLWTLAVSWIGWRNRSVPRWLCVVGGLTGVAMLTGVTGGAGAEVLLGPWLICVGAWLARSAARLHVSSAAQDARC